MALTFPTLAEQAADEFRNATETISVVTIAKRMGAASENDRNVRRYIFPDDTSLEVIGRGKTHKIETFLP